MINKVKHIGKTKGLYKIDLDVFELTPEFIDKTGKKIKYLTGGFYSQTLYPMCALYECDSNGNITNNIAIISEEGLNTYNKIFEKINYILI